MRGCLRGYQLQKGAVAVHSGFAGGVLFVGRSGAGKTSAAVRFARLGGLLVSTDRTLVRVPASGTGPIGIGCPEVVRLGAGFVSELGNAVAELRGSARGRFTDSVMAESVTRFGSKEKREFTFEDLRSLLAIRSVDSSSIAAVVFPEPTDRYGYLEEVEDGVCSGIIEEQVLHPDPKHGHPLAPEMLGPREARAALAEMIEGVPKYRLGWAIDSDEERRAVFTELEHNVRAFESDGSSNG